MGFVGYIDIDRASLRSVGGNPKPIAAAVEHIRASHARGITLYAISRNGAAYAQAIASELGIADCFAGFLDKPSDLPDDHNDVW